MASMEPLDFKASARNFYMLLYLLNKKVFFWFFFFAGLSIPPLTVLSSSEKVEQETGIYIKESLRLSLCAGMIEEQDTRKQGSDSFYLYVALSPLPQLAPRV